MNKIPRSHELKGKLSILKTTHAGDFPGLKSLLNDKETMRALQPYFKIAVWTNEAVKERYEAFKKQQDNGTVLTYTVKNLLTDEIVGDVGFKNIDFTNGTAEFGIILHRSTWGSGISKECHLLCLSYAFEDLGLKSVYFETDKNNLRMQGFFKKAGIQFKRKTEEDYLYYELSNKDWPLVRANLNS